jgi:hypothetical protein
MALTLLHLLPSDEDERGQKWQKRFSRHASLPNLLPTQYCFLSFSGLLILRAKSSSKKTFGDGDEFKAMRADAVMALANLVGKQVRNIPHRTMIFSSTVVPVLRLYGRVAV